MALYLGSDKVRINLGGVVYCLNIFSKPTVDFTNKLLASGGVVLKDKTGVYLIPRIVNVDNILTTSDNYILTDEDGLYLIFEEDINE